MRIFGIWHLIMCLDGYIVAALLTEQAAINTCKYCKCEYDSHFMSFHYQESRKTQQIHANLRSQTPILGFNAKRLRKKVALAEKVRSKLSTSGNIDLPRSPAPITQGQVDSQQFEHEHGWCGWCCRLHAPLASTNSIVDG